ncbi:hypothetical protein DM02DRAFT_694854 [Periconia macrospinosa]|uniref:ABM domain-containing protein n=1 Tax=Periconia macrospinosa TaxID=97972 RepID=A0A2V1D9E8_9PLEO|nr:hypothetical protein DM02DRAFT_694854 [Periconia macrospinosa]
MAQIIVTARIVCASPSAREKVLAAFHKIIEFTYPNEPDVLRYVVTLPLDDTTGTVLYMIEEYASSAANDAHVATAPVQDLIQLFTTGNVLAQPPEVHICPVVGHKTSAKVSRIEANPAIVLAHVVYKPDTLSHALKGWRKVVEYVESNEYWTQGYTLGKEEESNCVRTVEVYESWGFVDKVHAGSEAVRENAKENGKDRTGIEGTVRVRAVDGFMGRENLVKL